MIGSLRGMVQDKQRGMAIIEVGGVGYQLMMSTNTFAKLPDKGKDVFLHTHLHIREDVLQLFGFSTLAEKELFAQLIGVTNIGPKVALSVLSHISAEDLLRAIAVGDVDLIATIPGIGKKTAQRLVLELKDKLVAVDTAAVTLPMPTSRLMEAREALVGLGYSIQEANRALQSCHEEMNIEECIKAALKSLGG